MSPLSPFNQKHRAFVWQKAMGVGFKLGASVLALALIIAIVGASTNSAPIVAGVLGGLIVMIFAFVFIFKGRKTGDPLK